MSKIKQQEEQFRKMALEMIAQFESIRDELKEDLKEELAELDEKFKPQLEQYNKEREQVQARFRRDLKDLNESIRLKEQIVEGGRFNVKDVVRTVLSAKPTTMFKITDIATKAVEMEVINEYQAKRFSKNAPAILSNLVKKQVPWLEVEKDGKANYYSFKEEDDLEDDDE